jgi:hypothetical protein
MEGVEMSSAIDKAMVMERPCGTAEEMEQHLKDLYDRGTGAWSRREDGRAMWAIVHAMNALEALEIEHTLRHPAAGSALGLALSSMQVIFAAERRARASVLTEGREESRE